LSLKALEFIFKQQVIFPFIRSQDEQKSLTNAKGTRDSSACIETTADWGVHAELVYKY